VEGAEKYVPTVRAEEFALKGVFHFVYGADGFVYKNGMFAKIASFYLHFIILRIYICTSLKMKNDEKTIYFGGDALAVWLVGTSASTI